MRRPSIPFEAIGLLSRLRGTVVMVKTVPQEKTMSQTPPKEPTQVPDTLKDNIGKVPESFIEVGEEVFDDDDDTEEDLEDGEPDGDFD